VDVLDAVEGVAVGKGERSARGNLRLLQVGKEAVLFEDAFAGPAVGAVELGDDVSAAFEAHIVDSVLEAGERRAMPRGLVARPLHGGQHPIRCQLIEEVRHAGGA
jgi:hypothetical protein